jgi:hypothetical protein
MEIKIIQTQGTEISGNETHIFEGDFVNHCLVAFSDKNDFIEKYCKMSMKIEGCVIGVPEHAWDGKEDEHFKGYFAFCRYQKNEQLNFIAIMNATIYITCKGQTIDRFMV